VLDARLHLLLMPSNVYRRGDRFGARLTVGGRQVPLGTHDTREAAEAAVARARGGVLPSASTVAEWAAEWQALFPGDRNGDTERHNAQMVGPFVRTHGRRRLSEVDGLIAQAWATRSPGSVRYLRLMFGKAVKAGLLDRNVWDHVEAPKGARSPRVPPTPAELGRILDTSRARGGWWLHFADLIEFTAYSGLRLEEVADVQVADRLESGRLVVRGKRRAGEAGPRVRVCAVFGPGVEALDRQAPEVGRVWRSKSGRRLNKHSVGRAFAEVAAEVGYEGTFHALRHHLATWLLDRGCSPQDVAITLGHVDRAGHADSTQVRTRYGHPSVTEALRRLDELVTVRSGSGSGFPHISPIDGGSNAGDGDHAGAVVGAADGRA
jgi:integrase